MYCVNCGVRLADTENQCPLCGTKVYHPDIQREPVRPLYPRDRMPKPALRSKMMNGVVLILYLFPLLVSMIMDWQLNGAFNWFGYVAGGLCVSYVICALPLWFHRPNPVIFVPCDFVAVLLYLLYIQLATKGSWFMSFAFPVVGALGLLVSAVITLLRYVKGGRLYIWGGACIALGGLVLLLEFLLTVTFDILFIGWSLYPLVVLGALGLLLIYLGINRSAREVMERKLFF